MIDNVRGGIPLDHHEQFSPTIEGDSITTSAIVIDDDYDMVEIVSEILEMHGIVVVGKGYNGKEAIRLYRHFKPDVVLLDINMPNYDGFYTIDKIKLINPSAFIVALTSNHNQRIQKMLEWKKAVILFKPFEVAELITICKFKHNFELAKNSAQNICHLSMVSS